jgi:hypothetical protein
VIVARLVRVGCAGWVEGGEGKEETPYGALWTLFGFLVCTAAWYFVLTGTCLVVDAGIACY